MSEANSFYPSVAKRRTAILQRSTVRGVELRQFAVRIDWRRALRGRGWERDAPREWMRLRAAGSMVCGFCGSSCYCVRVAAERCRVRLIARDTSSARLNVAPCQISITGDPSSRATFTFQPFGVSVADHVRYWQSPFKQSMVACPWIRSCIGCSAPSMVTAMPSARQISVDIM